MFKECVLLWPDFEADGQFGEFFMAENRQKIGNDIELPGDGLMVWHVDASLQGGDFAYNNSLTDRKLLRLMEADGLEEIESGGSADAGDFYSAGMSFGATTTPSSRAYDGRSTGVEIRDIFSERGCISARLAVKPSPLRASQRNPAG
jgi:hypothetical protein